jgi:hypothetical protein
MTAVRATAAAALTAALGLAGGVRAVMLVVLGVRRLDGRDRRPCHRPEASAPRAAIDVPLALAIVAFGVLIIVDPSSVPGLTPISDDAGNAKETAP